MPRPRTDLSVHVGRTYGTRIVESVVARRHGFLAVRCTVCGDRSEVRSDLLTAGVGCRPCSLRRSGEARYRWAWGGFRHLPRRSPDPPRPEPDA